MNSQRRVNRESTRGFSSRRSSKNRCWRGSFQRSTDQFGRPVLAWAGLTTLRSSAPRIVSRRSVRHIDAMSDEDKPSPFFDSLAAAQSGDREAFARLYSERENRLRRILLFRLDRRIAGRVDVDDILQEVYLAAEQRLASFEGDSEESFFVWMRLVANQVMIDVHRRHVAAQSRDVRREMRPSQLRQQQTTTLAMSSFLVAGMTSPSSVFKREDRAERLHQAITSLSTLDQEVLALRHFEELSNLEVAEALDLSEQAASVRYVRALARLKKELESRFGEGAAELL